MMLLFLIFSTISTTLGAPDIVEMGCLRNPSLAFCGEASVAKVRKARAQENEVTEKDKQACAELRLEYVKVCAMQGSHMPDEKEREFCAAFENICFRIPVTEPDQATMPKNKAVIKELSPMSSNDKPKAHKSKVDFANFCRDFKNRYLFVCPDPFRFGQKAVVFCPIYSERCHVPLPDQPVVPTHRPPKSHRVSAVDRLCRSYRNFAQTYCNNPILLAQSQYREGCEKYWRFCTRRG